MTSPTNPANFSRLQLAARQYTRALADACERGPADLPGLQLALERARFYYDDLLYAVRLVSTGREPKS